MKSLWVSRLLYGLVGAFFGIAALVKIADPEAFFSSLLTYQVFPRELALGLALYAPLLELIVAVCLIVGFWRAGASLLTAFMLLLFIALVVQGLARGLELDCGCFGSNQLQTPGDYALKIGQNVLLLVSLFAARFLEPQRRPFRSESSL